MENNNKKQQRKFLVLGHIIHVYVSTGIPVSSKTVAQEMGGNISSATVRNIMAALEDEGYIEQPHTSAGRVPTHSGYRCYVDMIRDKIRAEKCVAQRLKAEYTRRIRTIREVIQRTSFLISRELHGAGIVMWPSIDDFYLKHLELVKVRAETVLAVLVTMTNDVKNYIIKLDRELEKGELEKISNFININYEHETFSRIFDGLKHSLLTHDDNSVALETQKYAFKIVDTVCRENVDNEIYWEGLDYLMDESDHQGIDITRKVFKMFAEKGDLIHFLRRELPYAGVNIYIGDENSCETLKECSVITSGYALRGRTVGRIGVIGSTRMDYDRALSTVKCLSDLISLKLSEINS